MENMIHQTSLKDRCQAWRTWYIKLLLKTGAKHGEHDTLFLSTRSRPKFSCGSFVNCAILYFDFPKTVTLDVIFLIEHATFEVLKIDHEMRVIVRFVNIFNCLSYDWTIRRERNVTLFDSSTKYHHYNCEFEPRSGRGIVDTTIYDKVCQWLATGRWVFFPPTNKTDRHDITEILLKVALNTINQTYKYKQKYVRCVTKALMVMNLCVCNNSIKIHTMLLLRTFKRNQNKRFIICFAPKDF